MKNNLNKIYCIIVCVYLFISCIYLYQNKIYRKELYVLSFIDKHKELGLQYTLFFNLWTDDEDEFEKKYQENLEFGGVSFDDSGKYKMYPSLPPGYTIISYLINKLLFFDDIVSARIGLIFFGLLIFCGFFIFALDFLNNEEKPIFMIFSATPFMLFHYYYSDINYNSIFMFFSLLSYLCFLKFIKGSEKKWFYFSLISFSISVWITFIGYVIIPILLFHLIFDYRFKRNHILSYATWIILIVLINIGLLLSYFSMIPDALEYLFSRVHYRMIGDVFDTDNLEDTITLFSFISRQFIRFCSLYNPIAFFLSIIGLYYAFLNIYGEMVNKRNLNFDTLDKHFILIALFILGVPTSFLLINGAYIHAYAIYYHCGFITLGATIGFFELISFFKTKFHFDLSSIYTNTIIGLFFLFSIIRSIVKVAGLSLIDLLYGGVLPSYY